MADKSYLIRRDVIRYKYGAPVPYPLRDDKEKIKHLHGEKTNVIAEE